MNIHFDGNEEKWLIDLIDYYDSHAKRQKLRYLTVKTTQVIAGASVTVLAAMSASALITALAGAAIVILEGIQATFQFHKNWIRFRSTCEILRREEPFYHTLSGPYKTAEDRKKLLIERLDLIMSSETATWVASRTQEDTRNSTTSPGRTTPAASG